VARATLPSLGSNVRGVIDLGGPAAEPFRSLRMALELRPETRRSNILVFTSPNLGDGKSTIAANYALVAALSQQRVLLIDADLRHPTLHEIFGVARAPGLIDVLGRTQELESALRPVQTLGDVDLLPAGTPVPRVGDVLASKRMMELLDTARNQYGAVIVDTPPILEAPDSAALAASPDIDVALVINGKGRQRPVQQALRKLQLVDANILGLVVNRVGELSKYGYGHR
jgi:capsular exopolysaccharide synthesis family protein